MKKIFIFFISLFILSYSHAQDSLIVVSQDNLRNNGQPDKLKPTYEYKTSFKKDGPVIALGVGLSVLGVILIQNKKPLTLADLANKTKDKIPFFDRGNAGFYSEKIDKDSYIPFEASFAMPLVMLLINKNERNNASHILVMYVESLSITSALFTMAAGIINRPRPLVYGTLAPTYERLNANNLRSFFAGHTASTASATFFAAKVFQDLNPHSTARHFVWIASAVIPAVVGYMRYKSGFHFLSDNLLGYAVGAASGILIPEWHKSKMSNNISFTPQVGKNFNGFAVVYNFK